MDAEHSPLPEPGACADWLARRFRGRFQLPAGRVPVTGWAGGALGVAGVVVPGLGRGAGRCRDPRLQAPALVAAAGTMSRVLVPCHVKGTVALQVGDVRTSQGRPGVLVLDVTFPSVAPFEVSQPRGRDRGPWAGLTGEGGRGPGVPSFSNGICCALVLVTQDPLSLP